MLVVIFRQQGLMGNKELSWDMAESFARKLFKKKEAA
jgi:hypothetical protein